MEVQIMGVDSVGRRGWELVLACGREGLILNRFSLKLMAIC